eukprot:CAMPEP_0203743264 /NCGR_PEP_ID=MMETSP0092-20131115/59353_1 /ASSEMBLY_ACC=CAM_ASM_001090 /TAXON_ID=426623 /ORGANISM="Chaetoceros affinis, Strain CCMP159" /LENGTH=346 /DNA_ID=CAMNT_0050630559 /DNA_START=33 /DNA_END=1073 /DNA_ORIENTATION=-
MTMASASSLSSSSSATSGNTNDNGINHNSCKNNHSNKSDKSNSANANTSKLGSNRGDTNTSPANAAPMMIRTGMTEERIKLLEDIGLRFDDGDDEKIGRRKRKRRRSGSVSDSGSFNCSSSNSNSGGSSSSSNGSVSSDNSLDSGNSNSNANSGSISSDSGEEHDSIEWETSFKKMLLFKKTFGHCDVPRMYKSDFKLGTWVQTQRTAYRNLSMGRKKIKNAMTKARIRRLEKIGFRWVIKRGESTTRCGLPTKIANSSTKKTHTSLARSRKSQRKKNDPILATPTPKPTSVDIGDNDSDRQNDTKRPIAEIILRKYGLYRGSIDYTSLKSLGHYYYLKNNELLDR